MSEAQGHPLTDRRWFVGHWNSGDGYADGIEQYGVFCEDDSSPWDTKVCQIMDFPEREAAQLAHRIARLPMLRTCLEDTQGLLMQALDLAEHTDGLAASVLADALSEQIDRNLAALEEPTT